LTISDNAKSVVADVRRIRNHPLVPGNIAVHGFIYDVKSGKLLEVPGIPK
jgi:carbonic anhydrase